MAAFSSQMTFNFTGKRILVTGASGGVGKPLALALSKAGAEVYALSNQQDELDALKDEDQSIRIVFCDLADWNGTRAKLEELDAMDGVVNSAGVLCKVISALEHTKESFDHVMSVNMLACVNVTQVMAKKMIQAGKSGSIVNLSSTNAARVFFGLLPYAMTKAAVDMMTTHFATELGPYNIRVNSVRPTTIRTPMSAEWRKEYGDRLNKATALGRIAEVSEVVTPVMYLLSDAASMVTGSHHLIDGGVYCSSII